MIERERERKERQRACEREGDGDEEIPSRHAAHAKDRYNNVKGQAVVRTAWNRLEKKHFHGYTTTTTTDETILSVHYFNTLLKSPKQYHVTLCTLRSRVAYTLYYAIKAI